MKRVTKPITAASYDNKVWSEFTRQDQLNYAKDYCDFLAESQDVDPIKLVTMIDGDNYQTYCDILFALTGNRDFEQVWEEEREV